MMVVVVVEEKRGVNGLDGRCWLSECIVLRAVRGRSMDRARWPRWVRGGRGCLGG